jgi:hypothetical protein
MSTNRRIFYAVESASIAANGTNTFTAIHGLQSIGVTTKFNLQQVFEQGQLSIYENIENIPEVEVNFEKCLDGYPLVYHLATYPSTAASLAGRSVAKCIVGLSIYSDQQSSASGTPLAQCTISGVYVSSLNYNFQTNGPATESVTMIGQNKVWTNVYTSPTFNNLDSPTLPSGTVKRQDFLLGSGNTKLPTDIPGVSGDNYVYWDSVNGFFPVHLQRVQVQCNLGREPLLELGHKAVYFRFVSFPVEVRTDIEALSITGDSVQCLEEAQNLSNQTIYIKLRSGTTIDLGVKNKMSTITYGGANAGPNGGNATVTFSYINFNDLIVTDPADPSGL